MSIYLFKCQKCGKNTEVTMSFKEHEIGDGAHCVGRCKNKKCGTSLFKAHQQINFEGYFNMNNSIKAKAYRKYNNKQGGPQAIVNGKVIGRRD